MNIQTEEQRLSALSALKKLSQSKGWKMILEHLGETAQNIENQLFEVSAQDNEIKYSGHDLKRFERANIRGLMQLPDNLIKNIDGFVFQMDMEDDD